MADAPRTHDDLESALREQFQLLAMYAEEFDRGNLVVAKPMATALRVLCHDPESKKSKSKSLLGQLGMKDRYFYDTAASPDELPPGFDYKRKKFVGSFLGIIGMTHTADLVPFLDSQENRQFFGFSKFDDYWNRVILLDGNEKPFSRRNIVHSVADQDGGSHVDPTLNADYRALTRDNSMIIVGRKGGVFHALNHIASMLLRQVTHEILRTFVFDYPRKYQIVTLGHPVFKMRMVAERETPPECPPATVIYGRRKPSRNDQCPCRSGAKYKKCHGKHFDVY